MYLFFAMLIAFSISSHPCAPKSDLSLYEPQDFLILLETSRFPPNLLALHIKLYEGYVKNSRSLLQKLEQMREQSEEKSYAYGALKRRLNMEMSGMRLHELYFSELGGGGALPQYSSLIDAIEEQFGSYEAWQRDFVATGMIRGIGWVVLAYDPETGRMINVWIEEHNLGNLVGLLPILVMDVWEHAYITAFGLKRKRYIDLFFQDLDWRVMESRFNDAG